MNEIIQKLVTDLQAVDDRLAWVEDHGKISISEREQIVLGICQVRATILLARQADRIAHALEVLSDTNHPVSDFEM